MTVSSAALATDSAVLGQIILGSPDVADTPIPASSDGTRPSLQEVAFWIKQRTKVAGGKTVGTFTDSTPATADDVEGMIDDALEEVLGKVQPIDPSLPVGGGWNAPGSDYETRIRKAVALYAAITVELSLFPEQVRNDQSPATMLQQRYESRIKALIAEGETGRPEGEGSGSGSGGGDSPADSYWSFPDAGPGGLVGYSSRWLYDPALFADWERLR